MTNFVSASNPYTIGLKPKAFLQARKHQMNQEKMHSGVNKDFYPKKDIHAYKESGKHNPYIRGFMELLPWVVAVSAISVAFI